MLGSGMNLITTVVGFGMSTTFIVFVRTRIICGRLRRSRSRPMFEIESRIDLEQPEYRSNGLEPVLVAAIPTMKFNHETFTSVEDAKCSICLEEYQEKETLRIMPKCGHNFHLACIDVWLRKQSTCPVCRFPIQDSRETKHMRQAMLHSVDSPETSSPYSRHPLPFDVEHSAGIISNREHLGSISENPEHSSREVQALH